MKRLPQSFCAFDINGINIINGVLAGEKNNLESRRRYRGRETGIHPNKNTGQSPPRNRFDFTLPKYYLYIRWGAPE